MDLPAAESEDLLNTAICQSINIVFFVLRGVDPRIDHFPQLDQTLQRVEVADEVVKHDSHLLHARHFSRREEGALANRLLCAAVAVRTPVVEPVHAAAALPHHLHLGIAIAHSANDHLGHQASLNAPLHRRFESPTHPHNFQVLRKRILNDISPAHARPVSKRSTPIQLLLKFNNAAQFPLLQGFFTNLVIVHIAQISSARHRVFAAS